MSIPTVAIFGADSDTGYRLAQLLVRSGRPVLGVIRREQERATLERLGADVAVADPTRWASVDAVFADREPSLLEVVCFIGGTPQLNSQGNINVIAAAEAAGVRRFVLTTSIGCGDSAVVLDPFVKAFAGKSIRAKDWAEKRLMASELDWTIIRSGGMTIRPGKGGPILVESPHVVGYINRTDLGDLAFQVLHSSKTVRRVYSAVDRAKAMDIKGHPLMPVEL
jgi:nucleoside-diphosphate-sugar epimerase